MPFRLCSLLHESVMKYCNHPLPSAFRLLALRVIEQALHDLQSLNRGEKQRVLFWFNDVSQNPGNYRWWCEDILSLPVSPSVLALVTMQEKSSPFGKRRRKRPKRIDLSAFPQFSGTQLPQTP